MKTALLFVFVAILILIFAAFWFLQRRAAKPVAPVIATAPAVEVERAAEPVAPVVATAPAVDVEYAVEPVGPVVVTAPAVKIFRATSTRENFDDLPNGSIGNRLVSHGIMFTGFHVVNIRSRGVLLIPSSRGFAVLDNPDKGAGVEGTITFVSPTDPERPAVTSFVSFKLVGLESRDGVFNGATVTALDADGESLYTFTLQPVGPQQTREITPVELKGPGIAKLVFTFIPNPENAEALTAPFDDLEFGPLSEPDKP